MQAVLEVPFFFFELHDISAGHHAFFFITCNELTLLMDLSVQVEGSIENFQIICRRSCSGCCPAGGEAHAVAAPAPNPAGKGLDGVVRSLGPKADAN